MYEWVTEHGYVLWGRTACKLELRSMYAGICLNGVV